MSRRYLLTGGAGFIASHIAEALLTRGDTVVLLDDLSTGNMDNIDRLRAAFPAASERIDFHLADAADPVALRRAMRGCEGAFHQAALVSVPRSIDTPHENQRRGEALTLAVLTAAAECGLRRVVMASSAAIYGEPAVPPTGLSEDHPADPISPYGVSKYAGELYARALSRSASGSPASSASGGGEEKTGLDTACLRYFNVYGPRQDPRSPYSGVISIFASRIVAGRPITVYGDGQQSRDFVYAADVAQANLRAMDASQRLNGAAFNVGSGRETSLNELVAILGRLAGKPPQVTHAPPRAGDIRRSLANIDRIRQQLGYAPTVDVETGLARLLATT